MYVIGITLRFQVLHSGSFQMRFGTMHLIVRANGQICSRGAGKLSPPAKRFSLVILEYVLMF